MKISTKGRYALRMMLEFALHPDEYTKINQVAERQQISEKYLEQIVTRCPGRLPPCKKACRIYGRNDSAPDRRKPFPCAMSGGRGKPVRPLYLLCNSKCMEKTGGCHQ